MDSANTENFQIHPVAPLAPLLRGEELRVKGSACRCTLALQCCLFAMLLIGFPLAPNAVQGNDTVSPSREVFVVIGAPGTEEYGADFRKWADRWRDACSQSKIAYREIDGTKSSVADAVTDHDQLKSWIGDRVKNPAQELWLILIGHGTSTRDSAKFNLRGPDVTDKELAEAFKGYSETLVIIDAASSSSPFLNRLSGKNRVIITATKSGSELNYSRFGDYFSRAIIDPAADLDHDRSVSVLEAFLSASGQVERFYEQEGRLATEQALLDDNGDERGTPASFFRGIRPVKAPAEGKQLDGRLASRLRLFTASDQATISDDDNAKLKLTEDRIETLRQNKAQLDLDEYYRQLESLMLEMASILK